MTPKAVYLKFQGSNKKPESGSYELKLGIIRIAAENPFSGEDDENPYKHWRSSGKCATPFIKKEFQCSGLNGISFHLLSWIKAASGTKLPQLKLKETGKFLNRSFQKNFSRH
ncbi:hypothetical protein U9M48_035696 [Paspalum notatum var. saurae]|uniref:Uncharacterized protein n=1 Tax=Paspalum notatum var. saurae TaxID=547442 RepID=A0AAQ3UFM5_PASNO